MKKNNRHQNSDRIEQRDDDLPGYPEYSEDEDIYLKGKEESDIDPEDVLGRKKILSYSKFFSDDIEDDESGSELDVPGSELDDDLEIIGSEDEENNYYSQSDNNADDLEDLIE